MSLTLIFAIPQEPFKKDGKKEEGLKHNMMAKKVTTVVKDVKFNNMELNLTHNKTHQCLKSISVHKFWKTTCWITEHASWINLFTSMNRVHLFQEICS